jgi:hypothetical protein
MAFDRANLRALDPAWTRLMALRNAGPAALDAVGADLTALGALRPCRRALCTLWPLRPLRPGCGALGALLSLRTLPAVFCLFGAVARLLAVGPRAGRCSDRQRGDARGEKQPSHRKISFRTAKTVGATRRSHRLPVSACRLPH